MEGHVQIARKLNVGSFNGRKMMRMEVVVDLSLDHLEEGVVEEAGTLVDLLLAVCYLLLSCIRG